MKKINLNLKGNIVYPKLWTKSGIFGRTYTVNLGVQIRQGYEASVLTIILSLQVRLKGYVFAQRSVSNHLHGENLHRILPILK